jgi:hypothetical protein
MSLLSAYPQLAVSLDNPHPCISAGSVPLWHELGESTDLRSAPGLLKGWRTAGGHYSESFHIQRPEYAQLELQEITPDWSCDITQIHGFLSSKADLREFESTDAMAESRCKSLIDEISLEKLAMNLAHREIRIIHDRDSADYFVRYQWDGRLWLMNDGGSHHTAAAKYIAMRLPYPVVLSGALHTYALNVSAIESLRREFEIFVINDTSEVFNAFFEAMRTFKVTWLWHSMPRLYKGTRAVLFPRSDFRSMRVAAELRKAGILDLGLHLATLAAK